jgi:hypothetical protein
MADSDRVALSAALTLSFMALALAGWAYAETRSIWRIQSQRVDALVSLLREMGNDIRSCANRLADLDHSHAITREHLDDLEEVVYRRVDRGESRYENPDWGDPDGWKRDGN